MSVAMVLGVDDVDGPAMAEARQRWFGWVEEEPALPVVDDLLELRDWTRTAEPAASDLALRTLARVGSESGGNDLAAMTALTSRPIQPPSGCPDSRGSSTSLCRRPDGLAGEIRIEQRCTTSNRRRRNRRDP